MQKSPARTIDGPGPVGHGASDASLPASASEASDVCNDASASGVMAAASASDTSASRTFPSVASADTSGEASSSGASLPSFVFAMAPSQGPSLASGAASL